MSAPKLRKFDIAALVLILAGSITLSTVAINWGQPATYSWHSDSIAGLRTVGRLDELFDKWEDKYPRVHFMVNGLFYKPFLDHWKKNPLTVIAPDGRAIKTPLDTNRISTLIIISRIIAAFMGAGAVLAVFLTARKLFEDNTAAILAALALSCSMLFVFYCHLGNLDIPAAFWFAWSCYWAVKAVLIGKRRHFVLLGLFCALAVCTKEPLLGFVIGLGFAVWFAMAARIRQAGGSRKEAFLSIFNAKVIVAVLVAVFCFALLSGLLTHPRAFFKRLDWWFEVGVGEYNKGFSGYGPFLLKTARILWLSLGWPITLAAAVSAVYCAVKYRWKSAFGIIPLLVFYVLIILRTRLCIPRYFIPGFAGLALLIGKACSDLLAAKKIPKILSFAVIIFLFTPSVLYCIGLDAELLNDSRYRAEKWFVENIDKDVHIATLSGIDRAPRLHIKGFHRFEKRWEKPNQTITLLTKPPAPDYVIMTGPGYKRASFDRDFAEALLAGSLGYTKVAHFENLYLYSKRTVLGFAGWPMEKQTYISPEITVLKKNAN